MKTARYLAFGLRGSRDLSTDESGSEPQLCYTAENLPMDLTLSARKRLAERRLTSSKQHPGLTATLPRARVHSSAASTSALCRCRRTGSRADVHPQARSCRRTRAPCSMRLSAVNSSVFHPRVRCNECFFAGYNRGWNSRYNVPYRS